jgi:hypothetical protein
MAGVGVRLAETIAPDLIVATDAVEELFAGQGVKSPVKGHTVDSLGQKFENLRCAEGLMALLEDFQDGNADGGPAKPGLVEELIGGFFGPGHDNIIYGVRPKGRRQ